MLNPTKAYHKGRARLVFAGQETLNGYQQLAVKYERNTNLGSALSGNPRQIKIRLPDRTLWLYGSTSRATTLVKEDVDAVVSLRRDLSMWEPLGIDMLLFNPIHSPTALDTRPYKRAGIDVLVDSGGFQLAQGTSDFIDPNTNVEFYNKHATIGVGLDFPAPPWLDALFYKQNCKLQSLNNEVIRAGLNEGVTLAPVIHGATPETRLHCLKSVYKAGRDRALTIAGMITKRGDNPNLVFQRVTCLMMVLEATRKDVLYYHFLGATSNLWLAIASLLAESGHVISAGGDSVSHRQAAIGGSYDMMPYFTGQVSMDQPLKTSVSARTLCPCPVCHVAGDARVLRDFRSSELHHVYVGARNQQAIQENVRAYLDGRINRTTLWNVVIGSKNVSTHRAMPDRIFDYIEAVIEKGFNNVKPLTPFTGVRGHSSVGLFGGSILSPHKKEVVDRVQRIHKTYEQYHKAKLS